MASAIQIFIRQGGELLKIGRADRRSDGLLVGRVYQGHAAALETRSAETPAVDAVLAEDDLAEGIQLQGTRLPIMHGRLPALRRDPAVSLDISGTPGLHGTLHAVGDPVQGKFDTVTKEFTAGTFSGKYDV